MIVYDGPDNLNPKETYARDVMVDVFNPVLKSIFAEANPEEFIKYGFNSCLQTGIFAGFILKNVLLPDYEIHAYKGQFVERINNELTPYMHCFNVASNPKDGRNILIDLSRTEKPLLFHQIRILEYPTDGRYKDMVLISKEEIDIDEHILMKGGEYYTGKFPAELVVALTMRMNAVMQEPFDKRMEFKMSAYRQFTHLLDK